MSDEEIKSSLLSEINDYLQGFFDPSDGYFETLVEPLGVKVETKFKDGDHIHNMTFPSGKKYRIVLAEVKKVKKINKK